MIAVKVVMGDRERLTEKLDQRSWSNVIERNILDLSDRVREMASSLAPRRTGELSESLVTIRLGRARYSVVSKALHAPFVEFGTRPHYIGSPVLIPGVGWRYVVMHPGTRPRPFLRSAVMMTLPEWRSSLVSAMRRVLSR